MSPRLHLAVDNCFASKRWTQPGDWMAIAADAGIYCIEASADNECDPLYTPPDALQSWLDTVKAESAETGVRVVSLYSGHGSYATLGLSHSDPRVRDHIQHNWLTAMIDNAAALDAGLGFYCHAFPQSTLRDPERYARLEADLHRRLAELATYAASVNLKQLSVEQMYSPHQPPWTINGAETLLQTVFQGAKAPLYLTIDTGHQVGQANFLRPESDAIMDYLEGLMKGQPAETLNEPWLGMTEVLESAHKFIKQAMPPGMVLSEVEQAMGRTPYLFAEPEDCDLYEWLRRLGAYSPIIHLQQTDGTASAHRPFTPKYNRTGIVQPEQVFAALKHAYATPPAAGMPPHVEDIYLAIEVFSGTAERPSDSIRNIRESGKFWRQYLPEDGLTLAEVAG
jgi:sugar phosphate isomerase/epimerase